MSLKNLDRKSIDRTIRFSLILFILLSFLSLLSISSFAIENSYPFIGRVIEADSEGIPDAKILIDFGDCISKEISTNEHGEFILTIEHNDDIFFKTSKDPCISHISSDSKAKLIITAPGCEMQEFSEYDIGVSVTSFGTLKIDSCSINQEKEFNPKNGGGGGSASSGSLSEEEIEALKKDISDKMQIVSTYDSKEQIEDLKNKSRQSDEALLKIINITKETQNLEDKKSIMPFRYSFDSTILFVLISLLILLMIDLILLIRYEARKESPKDDAEKTNDDKAFKDRSEIDKDKL